jgi:hypothetical protein
MTLPTTCRTRAGGAGQLIGRTHVTLREDYRQIALAALLHDASEYLLCDMPTPVKYHPLMEGYRILERRLQGAVGDKYGASLRQRILVTCHYPWLAARTRSQHLAGQITICGRGSHRMPSVCFCYDSRT